MRSRTGGGTVEAQGDFAFVARAPGESEGKGEEVQEGVARWDLQGLVGWHLQVNTSNFKGYFHFCKLDSHENPRECCFSLLVHFLDSSSQESESSRFEKLGVLHGSTRFD